MITLPATAGERLRAVLISAALLIGAAAAWPLRTLLLGPSPSFFGAYGTLLVATEVLTAAILTVRTIDRGDARAGLLACAYIFSAPLVFSNVVSLPGITPLHFGFQTPPWTWVFWHVGWASILAIYVAARGRRFSPRLWPMFAAAAASAFALALALSADRILPPVLFPDGTWTDVLRGAYVLAFTIDAAALAGMLRRYRDLTAVELWVTIAIVASAGEIFMIGTSTIRFSLGSYVGRAFSAVAGLAVWVSIAGNYLDAVRRASQRERNRAVAELNVERATEFRAFGDAVPQILWTAHADGSLDWYNRHWYDYTGQTPEEAAGWGWQAVHHPEDLPEVMRAWPLAIERGEKFEMEFRLRGRDGTFRWFLTRIHPYRNANGTVVRWFGANTDIDARRREADRTRRVSELLQDAFLPKALPQRAGVVFDAMYAPASSEALVGGDWYDAAELPNGCILLSIGDVAGHGLEAAIVAGRLRQSIFAHALENENPDAVLAKTDRVLRSQSDSIATALVAFFDPANRTLRYASAGHPAPIVATRDGADTLPISNGAPLGTGFASGGVLDVQTCLARLPEDAILALYTDGVIEFERDVIEGERRLLRALREAAGAANAWSAKAVLERVLDGGQPSDDIAVLLVRSGSGALTLAPPRKPVTKQWRFHSSHAQSAHAARIELTAFLHEHAAPGSETFNAELILGELLANTVEHAPGLVEVVIDWTASRPVLRLRDSGPGVDDVDPALPGLLDEDGRGLFLVRAFATRFDVHPAPGFGTEFIVELPLERAAASEARAL